MVVAFLIMLREGIEASLIVGIIGSYLTQTGRRRYLGAVWIGVVVAVALCVAVGAGLHLASAEFSAEATGIVRVGCCRCRCLRPHLDGLLDENSRAIDQGTAS